MKLDYSLDSPEERVKLVNQILQENPNPNEAYLEILANYLILCMEKQERKQKQILTENRMTTVNKRECSYEGLVSQLENGEDGIYNLINENKHQIFQPKQTITKKDIEEIPPLKQLREAIQLWETKLKTAQGRDVYTIKRALIEMRKDQYIIKNCYKRPIVFASVTHNTRSYIKLPFDEWIDENGQPQYSGISFLNPKVCANILQNFPALKATSWDGFQGDTWYLVQDFENLVRKVLKDYPLYARIVKYKLDNRQNIEIKEMLEKEFGFTHSVEYISSLWRNKIPKMLAAQATEDWLLWYYTEKEKGKWKKCSRCGQIKLAHTRFFSINKTSKDGFYSICKCCRNRKESKNI